MIASTRGGLSLPFLPEHEQASFEKSPANPFTVTILAFRLLVFEVISELKSKTLHDGQMWNYNLMSPAKQIKRP